MELCGDLRKGKLPIAGGVKNACQGVAERVPLIQRRELRMDLFPKGKGELFAVAARDGVVTECHGRFRAAQPQDVQEMLRE